MMMKVVIIVLAAILTISGVSLEYASNRNDIGLNNYSGKMMSMM
ncbi:hypothetical protein B0H39_001836 [Clostridium beijerinckii]|nr:hypothetical protein [Clostridium beijerinckii]NOW83955.1 hypothetical protein [Clostridium beijerinckii]